MLQKYLEDFNVNSMNIHKMEVKSTKGPLSLAPAIHRIVLVWKRLKRYKYRKFRSKSLNGCFNS